MLKIILTYLICVIIGCWTGVASASGDGDVANTEVSNQRPRICLVLGGGGARAAAHIGVLEALVKLRIPIDCIAGTSGGAIIGGLYASGYTVQQLQATFLRPDLQASMANQHPRNLLDYQAKQYQLLYLLQVEFGYANGQFFFPEGLITGNDPGRILNVLTLVTQPGTDFNKLPIPFRAVATNIDTGGEVVLDHGNLAAAMRASMSVPGAYSPVKIDGHLLVDGGLVDNVPVDVARMMGADIIIAVNVSTPLSNPQSLNNVVGVSLQVIKLLSNQNVNRSIASLNTHDVLIQPELGDITAVDFNRADEAIKLGELAALKQLSPLHQLQLSPQAYAQYEEQHRYTPRVLKRIDFIEIRGNQRIPTATIRSHMHTQIGQLWSYDQIGHDIQNLYRLGYFREVRARVAYEGDRSGLVITVVEKPWQPNYLRFGLNIEDDFEGGSQYELLFDWTRADINQLGGEWRNQFEMGSNRRIYSELYQPVNYSGTIFVAPQANYQNTLANIYNGQDLVAQYNTRYLYAGFDVGGEFGNVAELRVGPSYGHVNSTPRIGEPSLPSYADRLGGLRLRFGLDTLEGDTGFPTSGSYLTLNGFFARDAFGSDVSFDKVELTGAQVIGNDSRSLIFTTDVGSSLHTDIPFYDEFTLGGFLSLSGLREQQLRGQQVLAIHAIYLEHIGNLPSVLGNGFYIGGSLEGGNVWGSDQSISLAKLQYGGSVFIGADTVLGPLYLGTGFSQSGNQTFYLFIGLPFTLN
jgi:NTE family protein